MERSDKHVSPARAFARSRQLLVCALITSAAAISTEASATTAPLTMSGTPPASVTVGAAYSFKPAVSNPDGLHLRFGIARKPAWANFNADTGQLSGTPTASDVGTYANIVVCVTDDETTPCLRGFSLQVVASSKTASTPLTIKGSPPTSVTVGSTFSFQPTATGPSGKPLSFSVQNKPTWANFSIASGLLDGKPTSSQVGTYGDVVISASDGVTSAALPAFSVSVKNPVTSTTGSATINWTEPTQNTNGTALTDLAGIRIYYGTSASSLTELVQVAGTALTSYTISSLASGVWYFAAVAYTSTGEESSLSATVSKTVN
jgi:hypothetical protein